MRRFMVSFIIAFAVISVGLVCLMVYAINGNGIHNSNGFSNMELVNTQNISVNSIDSIDITYTSDNVEFYISDTEELILKEYMNYTPKDDELARIKTSGNTLSIKHGDRYNQFFSLGSFSNNRRVEVYLPSDYNDNLFVVTSSGNIDSDISVTLSEFTASSTSGNIEINEIHSDLITASASSGNIKFEVAEGTREFCTTSGNIKILGGSGDTTSSASSGNITIEDASGQLNAQASSGNIKVIDSIGGGSLITTSGNIDLELTDITDDLSLHASSGEVRLILPSTASFDFTAEVSSGNIRTFFDDELSYNKKGNNASGTIGENPTLKVDISTSSGNIRVTD